MRPRRGSTDGLVVRKNSAPRAGQQLATASSAASSPWQAPGDVLDPILQRLLASGEDGARWLRVASHVCSAWRSAALDILLADTAISKPPLEDFRAIGVVLAPAQRVKEAKKTDTVVTQAAMVAEASASTGMEAISKQRFDAPPAAAANGTAEGAGGTGRRRAGSRVLRRLVPRLARRQPSPVPADSHAAVIALQARQQLQQHEERRHDGGAAAMSPARPQATAQPQGSVQSDMAAAGNRRRAASESDSDGGSTLAQAGPASKQRRQQRGRGGLGTVSVEQPLSAAALAAATHQPRQQQEQRGSPGAGGQPSSAAQGRKRAGSAEEVQPCKRRQVAAGRRSRGAVDEVESPSKPPAGRRRAAGAAVAPEQDRSQQQRQHAQQQYAPERDKGDSDASGLYYEAERGVQAEAGATQQPGACQDQATEARPHSASAAVCAPAPAVRAQQPQRSGASGRVHAVMDFMKRIVGL